MTEAWRAGILPSAGFEESQIAAAIEPEHGIKGTRYLGPNHTDYLIEGPNMPLVAPGKQPAEIVLLMMTSDCADGGVQMTGEWEHAAGKRWTIRRWPDRATFYKSRLY